jgi:hypothetical protein
MSWPALPDLDFDQSVAVDPGQFVRPVSHRDVDDVDADSHHFGPVAAHKTVDESVTSSTTLQDDDDLAFTVQADETWVWEAVLYVVGSTAGDIRVAFTVPAGATLQWGAPGSAAIAATASGAAEEVNNNVVTASGTFENYGTFAGRSAILVRGLVVVGSTAGTVQLQWTQNASNATATTVKAGSHLIARRIA